MTGLNDYRARAHEIARKLVASRDSLASRSAVVMMGSAVGQGSAFLLLPLITRVYSPRVIGEGATLISLVSILAILLSLQYDQAIIVADSKDVPLLLILSSLICMLFVSAIWASIYLATSVSISGLSTLVRDLGIDWKLPVLSFVYGHFLILVNLHLRENNIASVALARSVYYAIGAAFQLAGALVFGATVDTFLIAQITVCTLCLVILFPGRRATRWVLLVRNWRFVLRGISKAAGRYVKFPKYQVVGNLLNSASIYAPIVFVSLIFTDEWAGWYYIAWRLLAVPTTLLSQAIGQVFFRDSAETERRGATQSGFVEKVVEGLVRVSLLPGLTIGILAPNLMGWLLGAGWDNVAMILRFLLIAFLISFFTSPISPLLLVKGKQSRDLLFKATLFGVRSIAIALGWLTGSPQVLVAAYSVFSAIVLVLYFIFILDTVQASVWRIWNKVRGMVWAGVVVFSIAIVLWLSRELYHPGGMLVLLLLSLLLYGRGLYLAYATPQTSQ